MKPYRVTVQTTLLVYAPSEDDARDTAWDRARWELGCQDAHDWSVSVEADSEVNA